MVTPLKTFTENALANQETATVKCLPFLGCLNALHRGFSVHQPFEQEAV